MAAAVTEEAIFGGGAVCGAAAAAGQSLVIQPGCQMGTIIRWRPYADEV